MRSTKLQPTTRERMFASAAALRPARGCPLAGSRRCRFLSFLAALGTAQSTQHTRCRPHRVGAATPACAPLACAPVGVSAALLSRRCVSPESGAAHGEEAQGRKQDADRGAACTRTQAHADDRKTPTAASPRPPSVARPPTGRSVVVADLAAVWWVGEGRSADCAHVNHQPPAQRGGRKGAHRPTPSYAHHDFGLARVVPGCDVSSAGSLLAPAHPAAASRRPPPPCSCQGDRCRRTSQGDRPARVRRRHGRHGLLLPATPNGSRRRSTQDQRHHRAHRATRGFRVDAR